MSQVNFDQVYNTVVEALAAAVLNSNSVLQDPVSGDIDTSRTILGDIGLEENEADQMLDLIEQQLDLPEQALDMVEEKTTVRDLVVAICVLLKKELDAQKKVSVV